MGLRVVRAMNRAAKLPGKRATRCSVPTSNPESIARWQPQKVVGCHPYSGFAKMASSVPVGNQQVEPLISVTDADASLIRRSARLSDRQKSELHRPLVGFAGIPPDRN